VLALRGALVLLVLAAGTASAQAPDAGRDGLAATWLSDPVSWWSEPGLPGYAPGMDAGAMLPWTLAGHVRGGWVRSDGDRWIPGRRLPGASGIDTPLGWLDTLRIVRGGGGGWAGFDAGLARVDGETFRAPPGSARAQRTRGDVVLATGGGGYSDNALSLRMGGERSWVWGEARSFDRDAFGPLEDGGRHEYDVVASRAFGTHRFGGAMGQYGVAIRLPDGREGAGRGAGGHVEYRHQPQGYALVVRLERETESSESFGTLVHSRRDAQGIGAVATLESADPDRTWGARAAWRSESVRRATAGVPGPEARGRSEWLAARWRHPSGDGTWSLELGAGHHDVIDRFEIVPSASYDFGGGPFTGRAFAGRAVTPIWIDLRAGQAPFLQSAWQGGIEVAAHQGPSTRAGAGFVVGRTRDRALVRRFPIVDLWLRDGFLADGSDYDFALLMLDAVWGGRHGALGLDGFALGRDGTTSQPLVDPSRGMRARAEWAFRAFKGDLGVRLGADAAAVGSRESERTTPRQLPSFVTYGASAVLAIEDVRISLRMLNLEDRKRPETWLDGTTGEEALGPGRELRFALSWRMFD
jgi:hypothetical protein